MDKGAVPTGGDNKKEDVMVYVWDCHGTFTKESILNHMWSQKSSETVEGSGYFRQKPQSFPKSNLNMFLAPSVRKYNQLLQLQNC